MDIVEKLRKRRIPIQHCDGWTEYEDDTQCHEAADEIERLRAIMETVADALHDKGDYECWAALRNALWQHGEKE